MRTLISSIFLCVALFPAFAQHHAYPFESTFDEIRAAGNIQLLLVASETPGIFLDSDELPELLKITTEGGKLIFKTPTELKKGPAVRVRLNYIKLSKLELSRGALVRSHNPIKSDTLNLKVDMGADVELILACDTLNVFVGQGGGVLLSGTTRSQSINASTGGNYMAYDLKAAYSWVRAGTASEVKVNSSAFLNARSTGKAFVAYTGSPEKTTFSSSMGGEITQQNE